VGHGVTDVLPPIEGPSATLRLVVVEGPDAGSSVVLEGPVLIGTSESCDLRLSDPTVSRRHAAVAPAAGGVRVRDEDSRNGTFIGAVRVRDADVAAGAELRVGTTLLRIESSASIAAAASGAPPAPAAITAAAFGRFLGRAPVLVPMYARLERAAAGDSTVLLEGESGSGKELLAEALHEQGPRAGGPLVIIDCGSVPETLIESELFGHERGAFTGADRARAGAFEQADGGTIFLDEIGELPLGMQTRLLRVLDRRQLRRVGGSETRSVDVRVVAATHRSLEREVEDGRFRLDLYHRLAVVLVRVPPLREREGDVELLARHFVTSWNARPDDVLGPDTLERLRRQAWPGNVRELRNQIERLVLLGDAAEWARASAPLPAGVDPATSGLPYRQARALALETFSMRYAEDMLGRHANNVSRAARAAGVARRHFQRLKK